jgi:hypothetical protein
LRSERITSEIKASSGKLSTFAFGIYHLVSVFCFKNERAANDITSLLSVRLCVPPLITFKTIDRFYEIQQGGHAIEGDLDAINYNPITLMILKW